MSRLSAVCGIAGLVGLDPQKSQLWVEQMLGRLCHRGPDESGIRRYPSAILGARRLAIIDVAQGHQPMTNEDDTVCAIQNGEIYNFRELRIELEARGHSFRTNADTEVLPHAYEEYGDEFATRLRGMFAVAIWDANRRRLVLVRDRMGKKPLVYVEVDEGLAFASEIQALLSLPVDRAVDDLALRQYLRLGYVPAPRTGFARIRKLRPGHVLVFEGRLEEQRRYWRLAFEPKLQLSEHQAIERLRHELDEAVRVRLVSEVPLGAFLSGGLDSSTVVAFMARHSTRPVRTFSIGFSEADFNELRYARLVAERFSTDHHELIVEPSALDVLPMLVRHVGEPFADSSIVPSYYVAKTARNHVTVALTGDGGDELFAGYDRYRAAMFASMVDRLPGTTREMIARLARRLPLSPRSPGLLRRARRFASVLDQPRDARYLAWISYAAEQDDDDGASLATAKPELLFGDALAEALPANDLDRLLAIDMRTYLPGDLLVKMDIATMAASLEARSPFLDQRLIEFVTRLPTEFKLRRGRPKYLLRRMMSAVLPEPVVERSKMGFGVPVGRWMRGPLGPLLKETVLGGTDRGLVNPSEVARLVREHDAAKADHGARLWSLLMLQLWFTYVVEGTFDRTGSATLVPQIH